MSQRKILFGRIVSVDTQKYEAKVVGKDTNDVFKFKSGTQEKLVKVAFSNDLLVVVETGNQYCDAIWKANEVY